MVTYGNISSISAGSSGYSTTGAYGLGRQALFERSLNNLGKAIDSGDINRANSLFQTFTTNFPQYSPQAGFTFDAVSRDFQGLAKALEDGKTADAKKAYAKLATDFADRGVNLKVDGSATGARAQSTLRTATQQTLLNSTFGLGTYNANGGLDYGLNAGILLQSVA